MVSSSVGRLPKNIGDIDLLFLVENPNIIFSMRYYEIGHEVKPWNWYFNRLPSRIAAYALTRVCLTCWYDHWCLYPSALLGFCIVQDLVFRPGTLSSEHAGFFAIASHPIPAGTWSWASSKVAFRLAVKLIIMVNIKTVTRF